MARLAQPVTILHDGERCRFLPGDDAPDWLVERFAHKPHVFESDEPVAEPAAVVVDVLDGAPGPAAAHDALVEWVTTGDVEYQTARAQAVWDRENERTKPRENVRQSMSELGAVV